jgi:Holliday junction resolvase RusA-like endonuclease
VIEYVLLGEPTALARPRFTKAGNVFDSQKPEKLRDYLSLKYQHAKQPLFMDPISIEVTFFFAPPKTFGKPRCESLYGKPYDRRIDLDNLIKYLLDVGHSIFYNDDKIVCNVVADKVYGPISKTVFTIRTL